MSASESLTSAELVSVGDVDDEGVSSIVWVVATAAFVGFEASSKPSIQTTAYQRDAKMRPSETYHTGIPHL